MINSKPWLLILVWGLVMSRASQAADLGDPRPSAATLAHACAGCHGTFGRSQGATPAINGRPEAELVRLLGEFKSGRREASVMNRIARGYEDEDFRALASFFALR